MWYERLAWGPRRPHACARPTRRAIYFYIEVCTVVVLEYRKARKYYYIAKLLTAYSVHVSRSTQVVRNMQAQQHVHSVYLYLAVFTAYTLYGAYTIQRIHYTTVYTLPCCIKPTESEAASQNTERDAAVSG